MNVNNVVRTITIRGASEGIDKLTADLGRLAGAQENVAVVSESSARRTLSIADAWKKQTFALDETARSSARAASATKVADNALREGLISTQQYADRLNLIADKFGVATAAAERFARAQSLQGVNSASSVNQRMGVKDDFGAAARANDIAAYGKQLDDIRAKFNPLFAAERAHKAELEEINRAARVGAISEKERADALEASKQSFVRHTQALQGATVQAGKFANQTGLNRYELLNLSRQMQDVGVSLAGGQSPFVVVTQQGSQILDVFQATTGSVRGFFSQAIGWAGRFATSTAGVVTATVAIGGAAAYAALKWNEAQVDISRSLIGIGRQSGAGLADINRIVADTAKNTKLSTGEARDLAIALTNTGRIGVAQIESLTKRGHDFAKVLGLDLPEANKLMAESFADPAKGVDVLGDKFGGFSAKMRQDIKDLAGQFRFAEAQKALESGLIPTLNRAGESSTTISKAWESTSKFFKEIGATAGRGLDRIFGDNPAAEKLAGATNERNRLQEAIVDRAGQRAMSGGRPTFIDARLERDLENVTKKVAQFQAEVDKVNGDRFTQLGNDAVAMASSIVTDIAQVNALKNAMKGFDALLSNPEALKLLSPEQVELVQRARDLSRDWTGYVDQLRAAYGNVSQAAAQTLQSLQLQTNLANARTAAEQQAAQYALNYANALAQTKNSAEAVLIATQQRVLAEAQINAQADQRLRQLQEEGQLIRAASDDERDRIRAAQEYNRLIEARVDPLKAGAIAAQMQANARSERDAREQAQADQDAARAAEQRAAAANAASAAAAREAEAFEQIRQANVAILETAKFIPFAFRDAADAATGLSRAVGELFEGKQGLSQFNPQGYQFKTSGGVGSLAGNFDSAAAVNNLLAGGGSAWDAFNNLLSGSLMKVTQEQTAGSGPGQFGESFGRVTTSLDTEALAVLDRLRAMMPEEQKQQSITMEWQKLAELPGSLERDERMKELVDSLKSLTDSTDNLASTMTDVLSPLYSSDPRMTHLGYRAFAGGGIMTPWGELPLHKYDGGGIATSPQVSVFGEGSTPEAYIPAPNGQIPIAKIVGTPANSNQPAQIKIENHFHGPVTKETADMVKRTAFQSMQQAQRALRAS